MLKRLRVLWSDQSVHGDGDIEPSERRFRTWVLAIAALVGPPLLFLLYYKLMFNSLFIPDSLDFAQLGRNMSSGKGLVTYVIRPLALEGHGNNPLRQPDLIHGPLYPGILALAFGVAGAKDSVVAWVSGLFYLLTIPLVYRLSVKVFSRAVAMVTVLVFTLNALMLEYAYSGLPNTLEIFLATWLLLVMYNVAAYVRDHEAGRDPKLPKGQLVTGGILLGLLYLTDTIFFWFAPLAIAWVFWLFGSAGQMGRRRWKAILMFAGWFAILALPLMFRYTRLGVNPIFGLRTAEVWMDTPNHYPGDLAYRLMPGELIASPSLFKAVVAKIILGVGSIIEGYPAISGSWILAFFLPSLLFRFTDPAANRLRQATMLLFLSILIGVLLFGVGNNVHSKMPLFVSTLPTMLAFAVAYLLYLIRQAQMRWQGLSITAALLAIAIVLPLGNAMFLKKKQKDITHEATAAQGFAKEIARQKADTAFSDMPQVVAWYANRPAIYIPQNDIQIRDLRNRFKNARYLFLTENVPTFGEEWRPLYQYFQQWNELCAVKRLANEPLPPRQGLFNTAQTGKQFLMALDGFYSIEPVKGGKRVVILASNGPVGTPAPGATPANAPPPGTPGQSTAGGTGPSRSADVRTP